MTPSDGGSRLAERCPHTIADAARGYAALSLASPVCGTRLAVTLPEAGVLLAANRLVRIAGYGWVAQLLRRSRCPCRVPACGARHDTLDIGLCDALRHLAPADRPAHVGAFVRRHEHSQSGAADRNPGGGRRACRPSARDHRRRSDRGPAGWCGAGLLPWASGRLHGADPRCLPCARVRIAHSRTEGGRRTGRAALRAAWADQHLGLLDGVHARWPVHVRPGSAGGRELSNRSRIGSRVGNVAALCAPRSCSRRQAARSPSVSGPGVPSFLCRSQPPWHWRCCRAPVHGFGAVWSQPSC